MEVSEVRQVLDEYYPHARIETSNQGNLFELEVIGISQPLDALDDLEQLPFDLNSVTTNDDQSSVSVQLENDEGDPQILLIFSQK